MDELSQRDAANKTPRRRWWLWLAGCIVCIGLALLLAGWAKYKYLRAHADVLLRERLIATLSARFHSPVTLDSLHIDTDNGGRVIGRGLKILYPSAPSGGYSNAAAQQPMVRVASFEFQLDTSDLSHPTTRIVTVLVKGLQLDIPPRGSRRGGATALDKSRTDQSKFSLLFDSIVCVDSRIVIETATPGKLPLIFDIARLSLTDVGASKPMLYDATLTNPKPVGDIHATGHFGPWQAQEPSDTALDGAYTFLHADLASFKGIAGILSSSGRFDGRLGHVAIQGTTDTPDFQLDSGDHPIALHTSFVAEVDGLNGDTILKHVEATLLHSVLELSGSIVRVGSSATGVTGHDTELTVSMDRGRIEDILTLATRTNPPTLAGAMSMREQLSLPPGKESLSSRIKLAGSFSVTGATFGNAAMQRKIDDLSMTAQGHPGETAPANGGPVMSKLDVDFKQVNGKVNVSMLRYRIPGATLEMTGRYLMQGNSFDFKGTMRTDATASQMTTGWTSLLLKPLDPLLKKSGAGLEVPITFSGTKASPKFSVDTHKLFR